MQAVSADFFSSLKSAHDVVSTLSHRAPVTHQTTPIQIQDGAVAGDVTAFVRRTLTFTVPNLESLFQVLAIPGGEITVSSGIRYGTTTEMFPQGVFRVDQTQIGYTASGQLQVTCPDRSFAVQQGRLGANRASIPSNTVWQEIQRLVESAFTSVNLTFPGWAYLDKTATTQVGPQVYDSGDIDTTIAQFCSDNSLEFYFDYNGLAVLRQIPTIPGQLGMWTVTMGPTGQMIDANRTRQLADTKNVIVLTTNATDVQLQAVEVANNNTPTVDPLSTGAIGRQVMDYAGNFRTTDQMLAAGKTLLAQYCAIQQQLSITTVGNPALDGWDLISAVLSTSDTGARPAESHVVQSWSLPLTNLGTQTITGRAVISA